MVTHKLVNDFLVLLCDIYTKKHGDSLSQLKIECFHTDDDIVLDFIEKNTNLPTDRDREFFAYTLIDELKTRGLAVKSGHRFNITELGLNQSKVIKHPFKSLLKTKFSVMLGMVISILTIVKLLMWIIEK